VTGVGSALLEWVNGGSALTALGRVSLAVCALVLGLIYRRYVGILGADRRKPAERQAYDALRDSLGEGNLAARLYVERLTGFLDWIDHFFGDAGTAGQRGFGLKKPAPLWTAQAFDRCLLLAAIYPMIAVLIIWVASGHAAGVEDLFGLSNNFPRWQRALSLVGMAAVGFPLWRAFNAEGSKFWIWSGLALGVFLLNAQFFFPFRNLIMITLVVIWIYFIINRYPGILTVGVCMLSFIGNAVTRISWLFVGLIFLLGTVIAELNKEMEKLVEMFRPSAWLAASFVVILFLSILCAARFLAGSETWGSWSPAIMFLGLLTLLNAPFDWASLGLTRALLRRGLELGEWWPYVLALVDAALAAVIIAALALTMVVGVQAFDALAIHGGGTSVLPLEALFAGIAAHPSAPEYWWLYALLLSTMIPSLVNLVIGGTSLARGLPGLPGVLLRFMPDRGGVLKWERAWIAAVLTFQAGAGAALGIAAQVFLVVVILGYIMPFFGLELLDMARDVAAFNLPARMGQLFGVSL
jgi:hypothetical protein